MIGFGVFIFPGPKNNQLQKNRTQTRTKVPISSNFLGIVFFLLGLEPSSNLLGHDNSQLPRANEHIVLSRNHDHLYTSRRYARRKREGRRLAWQMVFATKPRYCYPSPTAYGPCGEAMPTRGCGEGQQSHAAEGWQGTDATSMTPRCGVRCRLLQYADAGALCAVFFCCHLKYLVVVVLWALGQHTHIKQHAPRTQ